MAIAAAGLLAVVVAGCATDSRPPEAEERLIGDALGLPELSESLDIAAYMTVSDGSLSLRAVTTEGDLWEAPSSFFRGPANRPGRPLILDDAAYSLHLSPNGASALTRHDLASGEELWSVAVGPHVGSPYACSGGRICVHAHPEAYPVSTYRFRAADGAASVGTLGGRSLVEGSGVEISLAEGFLVATVDDGGDRLWELEVASEFDPPDVSPDYGWWAAATEDRAAIWLAARDDTRFFGGGVLITLETGQVIKRLSDTPCTIPSAEGLPLCFETDRSVLLVDWSGRTVDELEVEWEEFVGNLDYHFDEDARLVITPVGAPPAVIGPEGFSEAGTSGVGWCEHRGEPVSERGRDEHGIVEPYTTWYPCDLETEEPLEHRDGERLARRAESSAFRDELIRATDSILAYFTEPDVLRVVSGTI